MWDCRLKKRKEGIFHASIVVEDNSKEGAPEQKETKREYCLVFSLLGYLIIGEYTWMIDGGASKHISGYKGAILNIKEKQFACMVELGDNSTYSIQGVGSTSFKMNSGDTVHVEDIIYVPILSKNLLSLFCP